MTYIFYIRKPQRLRQYLKEQLYEKRKWLIILKNLWWFSTKVLKTYPNKFSTLNTFSTNYACKKEIPLHLSSLDVSPQLLTLRTMQVQNRR